MMIKVKTKTGFMSSVLILPIHSEVPYLVRIYPKRIEYLAVLRTFWGGTFLEVDMKPAR